MADALETLRRLRGSLADFAGECLRIRTKAGTFEPLVLNASQLALHAAAEGQLAQHGWVRILVLKGRQQGISTYVAARFYHKTTMRKGVNTYILTHKQDATDNLFDIVDRYNRNNPIAPHVGASNTKELVFDKLESSYQVATAGGTEAGRGRTTSQFHGSEVPLWPNARAHFAASVQAVPGLPGTEIILEGTSAGPNGEFYERWLDAEAGVGDYIAVFLPWFLEPGYRRAVPPDFQLSPDADDGELSEVEYKATYGLDDEQMFWRRMKIAELRSAATFKREYPADPSDAWTATGDHEPLISPLLVLKARKRERAGGGPLIIGVDPASGGGDRFAVAARRGNKVLWVKYRNKINTLEATTWLLDIVREHKPARMNIDSGNIGAAIVTNLKASGPEVAAIVRGIDFGGTSQAKLARPKVPGPKNRRAEMWSRVLEWLELPEGASLPDEPALQSDLTSVRRKPTLDNNLVLESKDDMKRRGVRSPDLGDAVALTFASNEFFQNYSEDTAPAQFGLPDSRKPATAPQYVPPSFGPTGWMG